MGARILQTRFTVMCDVENPLLGGRGAARVFAPQKGASPQDVERLEAGMANYACVLGTLPGFDAIVPAVIAAVPVEEALAHAEQNYRLAAACLFTLVKIGASMH